MDLRAFGDVAGGVPSPARGRAGQTVPGAMKLGYARVSTEDQNLAVQRERLQAAGCECIFEDTGISGSTAERPGLTRLLETLEPGNILVVWRLDRLGRSLAHLVTLINELRARGVEFQSLQEQIDTTNAGGRFYFHLLAALAEFERELISERTRAGMASARRRGARIGRPPKLTAEMIAHARTELAAGRTSIDALARTFDVSARTVTRALEQDGGDGDG